MGSAPHKWVLAIRYQNIVFLSTSETLQIITERDLDWGDKEAGPARHHTEVNSGQTGLSMLMVPYLYPQGHDIRGPIDSMHFSLSFSYLFLR